MNLSDHPRISVDPRVLSGKPAIRGTRVPVFVLVQMAAEGMTLDDLVGPRGYPFLELDDVRAALAFAADLSRDPKFEVVAAAA